MDFESWLEDRYLRAFMKDAIDWDRSGEHVTDYAHPCPRQIYYKLIRRRKDPMLEKRLIKPDKANIFWMGKKYHEIPISNVVIKDNGGILVINEFGDNFSVVEEDGKFVVYGVNGIRIGVWGYEFPVIDEELGVVGRIDDLVFYDGELYIVDKKTASYIPQAPYDQYVNQVKIYAGLVKKNYNIVPTKGAILFIRKRDMVRRAFTFELGNLDAAYNWFAERVKMIREAIESGVVPVKNEGSWCKWCEFKDLCEVDANDVPLDWGKIANRQLTLGGVLKK